MIKQNKKGLLLSSLVILLPMFFGLLMWNRLPERMTTHWGISGQADGSGSRAFAVFMPPLLMLLMHWLCVWLSFIKDRKNIEQDRKIQGLVLWIFPITSLFACSMQYAAAFGISFTEGILPKLLPLFLGVLFLAFGNYMPKCRQNHTIGIRVKWTLASEENWNATHRFAGKVWVLGGFLIIVCGIFLPSWISFSITMPVLIALTIIPVVYSWRFYRDSHVKALSATMNEGVTMNPPGDAQTDTVSANDNAPLKRLGRRSSLAVRVLTTVLLAGVIVLLFTGDIRLRYDDTSFTIEASYWNDLTVDYEAVSSVEYWEDCPAGVRVSGFGSARLAMGLFQSEEFGNYTRYAYAGQKDCVVLHVEDQTLVISGKNTEDTKAIYNALKERISHLHQKD